jgi:acetyltransferase EpsM
MSAQGEAMSEIVVIGGGEHARVVMDAIRSCGDRWRLVGFVDPAPCDETAARLGVARLGDDGEGLARAAAGVQLILGIGPTTDNAETRAAVAARYDAAGARWAAVAHARATVAPDAALAPGALVAAGAVVNTGARIGAHTVINSGAVVEHDCEIGPFAHVAPGALVGGGTRVGARAFLGLGCRVRDHVLLGDGVVVAMGAVVTRSIASGVVLGVPARERRDQ